MFMFIGHVFRNSSFTTSAIRKAWATRKAMKSFAAANKECAWCGRTKRLHVHHVLPVSVAPDLAGVKSNMLMLCGKGCHIRVGHNGNYRTRYAENIKTLCMSARVVKTDKGAVK